MFPRHQNNILDTFDFSKQRFKVLGDLTLLEYKTHPFEVKWIKRGKLLGSRVEDFTERKQRDHDHYLLLVGDQAFLSNPNLITSPLLWFKMVRPNLNMNQSEGSKVFTPVLSKLLLHSDVPATTGRARGNPARRSRYCTSPRHSVNCSRARDLPSRGSSADTDGAQVPGRAAASKAGWRQSGPGEASGGKPGRGGSNLRDEARLITVQEITRQRRQQDRWHRCGHVFTTLRQTLLNTTQTIKIFFFTRTHCLMATPQSHCALSQLQSQGACSRRGRGSGED
ncbi:hypothetical protein Bbelb_128540 [Branchiostoma belcheri]|nr:hypothetical protein Bbelb_128540 [Branchiostoma belcheri]